MLQIRRLARMRMSAASGTHKAARVRTSAAAGGPEVVARPPAMGHRGPMTRGTADRPAVHHPWFARMWVRIAAAARRDRPLSADDADAIPQT